MKRYLTTIILLFTIGTANGARFQYYAGGFEAYYNAFAQDGALFDSRYFTMNDISYAWSAGSAVASVQADSSARSDIQSEIIGNSLRIDSYSFAHGFAATYLCEALAETYGSTQDNQTLGIFYQINPDSGEQVGDDVMVYYSDIVSVLATGTTYYCVGGPETMAHMAITRNQLPSNQEPDSQKEVLRFPNVELSNTGGDWFSGVYAFPAKIGDVIGIYIQTKAVILLDPGPLTGDISYSNLTMILTVKPILLGDSDYDDDVDFYDLAIFANNWLEGVGIGPPPDTDPPTPNPMQWASTPRKVDHGGSFNVWAEMTAKVATDPSGGIQYKFECTNDSGYSSGGAADCVMNPGNCPEWRSNPYFEVKIGSGVQTFNFRVRARDIHDNKTDWSSTLPALF